jgi:sulfhydrogenase subunit alpha
MEESREFEVKALARVEGEGRLYARIKDREVEHVELNIYEPPRFFESFLRGRDSHEVPDITARICGICPVAYQMTACGAIERALELTPGPDIELLRRLLYCGEWIESHVLHIHLLHLPDFLGYHSGLEMAQDHREVVERGLKMKKIGNELIEILGGRPIHPINVRVGGFYRAPDVERLRSLLPDLKWALDAALKTVHFVSTLDFPQFEQPYEFVSLYHPEEYPMNGGRVISSEGLDIAISDYEQHFKELHVPQSTALHSVKLPDHTAYLVGPLSRINLCLEQLTPKAKKAALTCGVRWPSKNNFHSIVARSIEVAFAFEEAIRIVQLCDRPLAPSFMEGETRSGTGQFATEAPRGLLYHRYELDGNGQVEVAQIIPPTSQNQGQIESDLRQLIPELLDEDDAFATHRCEHLIRNYDPCISCATHFLKLKIDEVH